MVPGLAALAYSVLSFRPHELRADPVDCGVLRARGHSDSADQWCIGRSTRVHRLIMGVVFERDPPAALAIGPAFSPKEPASHVLCVATMLAALAMGLRAHVEQLGDEAKIRAALTDIVGWKVGQRAMRQVVSESLTEQLPSANRRVVVATAAALAAAGKLRGRL